jgi:hypothetical protein
MKSGGYILINLTVVRFNIEQQPSVKNIGNGAGDGLNSYRSLESYKTVSI